MGHVIQSLLDTDMYKLTMHQVILHKFPGAYAKYRFKCRNDVDLTPYIEEIKAEFDHLCTLRMSSEELEYLKGIPYLTNDYVDFLEDFRPKRRYIHVDITDGKLDIWFQGPVVQTLPFEIWALKIVNEVYFRNTQKEPDYRNAMGRLDTKIQQIKDYLTASGDKSPTYSFKFADFGTRRAFSGEHQKNVVRVLSENFTSDVFVGTSNVKLAMEFGITPIGSMAHEYIQMFQGISICPIGESQRVAFQTWADEFRGSLGIALSDTLGMGMFLKDLDLYFAKLFDGVRQDSGDPFQFADEMIDHYKGLGIDPMTKTIVFSDGLDVPLAIKLAEHCKNRIKTSFGIGTNLTNDFEDHSPLQIVIKMIMCGMSEGSMNPVAKLSNNPSKSMCEDAGYSEYLSQVIERRVKSKFI